MATMGRPLDAAGRAAAWCSCVLGLGSAGAYWALDGTALLDTDGGSLEEWGRERSPVVVTVLAVVAVVKVGVAIAAPVVTGVVNAPAWATARAPRVLSWIAAVVLTAYGRITATNNRRGLDTPLA
jgi:hypothetical protein